MNEEYLSHIAMSNMNYTCYIADIETHDLLYINETIKNIIPFGYNSIVGKKCYEVLAGFDKPCNFCTNTKIVKGKTFQWENCNPLINRYFDISATLIEVEGRKLRLEFAVDIDESKRKFLKLETQLTIEETLVRCAQTLSGHENIEIAINKLLATICEFYDADRAFVFEISKDNLYISNTYEWNSRGIESQQKKLQSIPIDHMKKLLTSFETENELYIDSTKIPKIFNLKNYEALKLSGLEKLIVSALKIDKKIIGFFGVENPINNVDATSLIHSVSLFLSNDLDKKKMIHELKDLASIDTFTGLYNRNEYIQTIGKIAASESSPVGIAYFDVNGLKQVNDEYGHEYGDRLILKVTDLLKTVFKNNIFRIGGDEFVVIYLDKDSTAFEKKIVQLRATICNQTDVSVSLGSTWCSKSKDIFKHIGYADELMYVDKQSYYTDRQFNRKNYRANVAANLRKEILLHKFAILLQPKICLTDEKIVGAEALVRKKNAQGGLILPDKFIPIYELDGIILYLDYEVLRAVCETLKEWRKKGHPLIPISVNFSRITILDYNVAQKIHSICEKYGIEPKFIKIELTERIGTISVENLSNILSEIQSYGFKISLDDFGTSYSNLITISSVNFDEIKLDKSLIDNLATNPSTAKLINHVVGMCNAFRDTEIVVEGIETYEQVKILRSLNCNINVVQGFYFSKPLTIEDFLDYYLSN